MSGQLSKRQQARNERILQDLIKTVPGNNVCADCETRNPGWASWSLGVFLCMRCAALHRKLGTHITKVKSLSMDSWSYEQVETMKRIGNLASNRIHNPQNAKAPIEFDASGNDAAMERFIREKYQKKFIKVSQISSPEKLDIDDHPPPLPPKTGNNRFGLRSASSIFPLSSKHKKEVIQQNQHDPQPVLQRNKPSHQVFGITFEGSNDYESKNFTLRDMGFTNQDKNMAILKEQEGKLENSIEKLVCFGESVGGLKEGEMSHEFRSISSSMLPDRVRVPTNLPSVNAADFNSSQSTSNPFTLFQQGTPTAQPQSSQSTGVLQHQMTDSISQQLLLTNINGLMPSQPSSTLNPKFQHKALNKSHSLFPNRTGPGFPGTQVSQAELHQKSITPPVPYLSQQYHTPMIFQTSTKLSNQIREYNPFIQPFQQGVPLRQTDKITYGNDYQSMNPSLHHSLIQHSSIPQYPSVNFDYSVQQSREKSTLCQPEVGSSCSQPTSLANNQQSQALPHTMNGMGRNNQFQMTQQQINLAMPQPAHKIDSQSILDLYNYPHLAPSRPAPKNKSNQSQTIYEKKNKPNPSASTTTNSRNPFASDLSVPSSPAQGETGSISIIGRDMSQESLSGDGGWMNGRHSPDAWRSISARSMR